MNDVTNYALNLKEIYPRRNSLVPIVRITPDVVRFGIYPWNIAMTPATQVIFDQLNGDQSALKFIEQLTLSETPQQIIRLGLHSAALLDANAIPNTHRWLSETSSHHTDADITHLKISMPLVSNHQLAKQLDRRHESLIHIAGSHQLASAIQRAATSTGIRNTSDSRAATIIVFPSMSHPDVPDHNFSELETRPHLHVGIRHCRSVVGPLVTPGAGSCIRCAFLHRRDIDSTWPLQAIAWRNSIGHSTADPLLINSTAYFAVALVRRWLESADPNDHTFANTAWESQLPLTRFDPVHRPPHPLCGCQLSIPTERR